MSAATQPLNANGRSYGKVFIVEVGSVEVQADDADQAEAFVADTLDPKWVARPKTYSPQTGREQAEWWAKNLVTEAARPRSEEYDTTVYDRVWDCSAEQVMLEGNGPTTWATIVTNSDDDVLYVVVESFKFDSAGATVIRGQEAEQVAKRLREIADEAEG